MPIEPWEEPSRSLTAATPGLGAMPPTPPKSPSVKCEPAASVMSSVGYNPRSLYGSLF